LQASKSESDRAEIQRVTCRSNLDAAAKLRVERNKIAGQIDAAKLRAQFTASLQITRAEVKRPEQLIDQMNRSELRERRTELSVAAESIYDEITRLTLDLSSHDERARTLAEAVSRIAHQLAHDDTNCPACATSFEVGKLKLLALENASPDAAPAAELGQTLAAAKLRQVEVNRNIAEIDRGISEYTQLVTALAEEQSRETSLVQKLIEAGGMADEHYGDSAVLELRTKLASVDREILEGPSQDTLATALSDAEAAIEVERIKRINLERTLIHASSDLETARSLLTQHPEFWSVESGLLVSLEEEETKVQTEAIAAGERLKADQKQLDDTRIARDGVAASIDREVANLTTVNVELDNLAEARSNIVRRWIDLGQTGDPDSGRVSQLRTQIKERQARAKPIAAAHTDLIDGLRIWQKDQQLQERERAIATIILEKQLMTEVEAIERLEADVATAKAQLDLAQRARDRMEDVGKNMKARAEKFADDVLKPLNNTIQRFSRTLMTWSDASIIYQAEHHATRSELRPATIYTDVDGAISPLNINPNYFFSEGQLSALSVSALLAASTTFSWSRWRGLLLDDPLQHNDIIHASAFMDLLRQMVRELGYQVILSTHDSSEAEFLARKPQCGDSL